MIQYYCYYTLDTTDDEGVQAAGVEFTGMTTIDAEIADDDDAISDQISNETGWLVESYSVNRIPTHHINLITYINHTE